MGWAKYVEDNMEMFNDRFYKPLNADRYREDPYIEVRAVLPVAILPMEVNIAIATTPKRTDRTLYCRDCGKQFVFSAGEQNYFEVRGYKPPKRCKCCREINKIKHVAYGMRRP